MDGNARWADQNGLPVLEGLTITARTVSNRRLRLATETMADAVREGGGLSAAMRRADVFPPILVYMTASGESSGRLEPMLDRAADYWPLLVSALGIGLLPLAFRRRTR